MAKEQKNPKSEPTLGNERDLLSEPSSQRKVKRLSVSKSGRERLHWQWQWSELEDKKMIPCGGKDSSEMKKTKHYVGKRTDCSRGRTTPPTTSYQRREGVLPGDNYNNSTQWQCDCSQVTWRLLNCRCAPCFGAADTWFGCLQDWLTVCPLHLFDIFTTYCINAT